MRAASHAQAGNVNMLLSPLYKPSVNTTTPDSLDVRLFSSVVLAVAPAVTMDEASPLSG